MTTLYGKKKDYTDSFGNLYQGAEFEFTIIEPTKEQVQEAIDEGSERLLDGRFVWGFHSSIGSDKICFLYLKNVEYFISADGRDVQLIHEGNGKFRVENE